MGESSIIISTEQDFELNGMLYPLIRSLPNHTVRNVLYRTIKNLYIGTTLVNNGLSANKVLRHQQQLVKEVLLGESDTEVYDPCRDVLAKMLDDKRIPQDVKSEIAQLLNF